jgi:hypothetical protein
MKRYKVTSDTGPAVLTWAYSSRNARFSYSLAYGGVGHIVVTEVEG